MLTFFDSSAFAKRFIEETGSDEIEKICLESDSIALSSLCFPEIISALNRRLRENDITKKEYHLIKERMIEEFESIEIINVVPEVIGKTSTLLEKNNLRTLDAIHIASALIWKAELFVSADKRQTIAAKKAGLKVKFVE
ncbi:MAG: type II toxin-antitoxin system VapC family toxin [Ignavibacteriaceae bacterium]|nr:type II toxin-antitoxin system VapC family toxin [Ignavibacterium sp.]MCC6255527.1 type II toxin-antitoxin system VapC family toxin [Ignavibacteriaceae bacterium]HMN23373.1 type II toxin-antitoxin system VapC family toxin [Ignavibacteriaceae bacterium]HRN26055.1 type II toxin-antitoxin system VapC family toxin [Ignavibacteriaceae bacterium]HRP92603.1 type II toxin-antitoxin system VapC family toxin [Ignavibacteriaceae bacterium]